MSIQIAHFKHKLGKALANAATSENKAPLVDTEVVTSDPRSIVSFRCNICGKSNTVRAEQIAREIPSCSGCSSTVRFRAIIDLLLTGLFGDHLRLDEMPVRKDIVGVGLSDAGTYPDPLTEKFDYTNTFFHCEPRLDIVNPPASAAGRYDFLISSDVFEHVVPPVSKAFSNARRMLKPGGVFVFTVPFGNQQDTIEHYPNLHDYRICEERGGWTLHNRTGDGRYETFTDLVFHGGPGDTLEMRVFSRAGLEREFARAGFKDVRVASEPCFTHGIIWPEDWSVPIVARA